MNKSSSNYRVTRSRFGGRRWGQNGVGLNALFITARATVMDDAMRAVINQTSRGSDLKAQYELGADKQ